MVTWLGTYYARTPGLITGDNSSVLLDGRNEPQPDTYIGIPVAAGGQTRLVSRGEMEYVEGAPELVVEISGSTRSIDLNAKLRAYERNGVREYVTFLTKVPRDVHWRALRDGSFERAAPDTDGLLKSRHFPGLWLDPNALLAGDLTAMLRTLERGCATPEHAAFVERLAAATA